MPLKATFNALYKIRYKIRSKSSRLFASKSGGSSSSKDSGSPNDPNSFKKPKPNAKPKPKKLKSLFDVSLTSGLYVIHCLANNKKYVGCSTHVRVRLTNHKSQLRRGVHENRQLQEDFKTHGIKKFRFESLSMGKGCDKKELEQFETMILSTLPEEERYNAYVNWRTRGAETNPFYGRSHTPEARAAQSDANKGKPSGFSGKSQSNEVKELLSQQNSGKTSEERRKPIFIADDYYESVLDASIKRKMSRRLIRERLNSTEPRWENYKWKNPSDGKAPLPEETDLSTEE